MSSFSRYESYKKKAFPGPTQFNMGSENTHGKLLFFLGPENPLHDQILPPKSPGPGKPHLGTENNSQPEVYTRK